MKQPLLLFLLLCCVGSIELIAQVKINGNSVIRAKGLITTNASLANTSANADLKEAEVTLVGTDQHITTNQELVISSLSVNNNSTTTVIGNWKITNTIGLMSGILHVNDNSRLLYTGTTSIEGNDQSYVEGYLTQSGTGRKFFPLGAGGLFLPASIEDVPSGTSDIGMRAVQADAAFVLPAGISTSVNTHYWQLTSVVSSPVSLGLTNSGPGSPENFVVLESESTGGVALPLSSSVANDFIFTTGNVTKPLLTIGKREPFSLVIHDMITPFVKDEINDGLVIGNLELAQSNTVTLLDRWGVQVKEWKNYTNDIVYDFTAISPGNYICIVEFTFPDGSHGIQKGMITILNTK